MQIDVKSCLFFVKINDMIIGSLSIFYWSSDTEVAEVDFITQIRKNNVPIEVKLSNTEGRVGAYKKLAHILSIYFGGIL